MLFKKLTPGDTVLRYQSITVLAGAYGGLSRSVIVAETVERVTATQAVTTSGLRFTLREGTIHGTGNRGGVYPVGYVKPYPRNAIDARPMEATSPEEIAKTEAIAAEVERFNKAFSQVDRNFKKVIRHVLTRQSMQRGSEELAEIARLLERLTEGFKP